MELDYGVDFVDEAEIERVGIDDVEAAWDEYIEMEIAAEEARERDLFEHDYVPDPDSDFENRYDIEDFV